MTNVEIITPADLTFILHGIQLIDANSARCIVNYSEPEIIHHHFRLLNGMTERKPIHVDKQYKEIE